MTYTIGIDIGSGVVKTVLFDCDGENDNWLCRRAERIRRRDPQDLAKNAYLQMLAEAGVSEDAIAYVATTGEGENVFFCFLIFCNFAVDFSTIIPTIPYTIIVVLD